MPRSDGVEVPRVQSGNSRDLEALGDRDDRRVGGAEREVRLLVDQLRGSAKVVGREVGEFEVAGREEPQEV